MTDTPDYQFHFGSFATEYDRALKILLDELDRTGYLQNPRHSFTAVKGTKNIRTAFEYLAETVAAARSYASPYQQVQVQDYIVHMGQYTRCRDQGYITDLIHSVLEQADLRLPEHAKHPPTFLVDQPSTAILEKLRGIRARMLIPLDVLDAVVEVN